MVGLADERLGERVVAAVELDGAVVTEDELAAHCLANLAKYKVPERWVFVDGFPRNSMNKIQRPELPALLRASLPVLPPRYVSRVSRDAKRSGVKGGL